MRWTWCAAPQAELDARLVQPYYALRLAADANYDLAAAPGENSVTLSAKRAA